MNIGERIKFLRKQRQWSLHKLEELISINYSVLSRIESGKRPVTDQELNTFANIFQVTSDFLLGREQTQEDKTSKLPELTDKDERDIMRDLEKLLNNLDDKNGYAQFDGQAMEDMDEEDRELLKASLENSLRLAKRLAKQKFTPKKYRK